MRKLFIGLLLAATAAAPAFADKGGNGGGKGRGAEQGQGGGKAKHGGGEGRGGGGAWKQDRGQSFDGGGREFRPVQARLERGRDRGFDRANRSENAFGFDRREAKQDRKAWKREAKAERRFARVREREIRYRPQERVVQVVPAHEYERRSYVRNADPLPVRYVSGGYSQSHYLQPLQSWTPMYQPVSYAQAQSDYWPSNYAESGGSYGNSGGLFGSDSGGLLGGGSGGLLGSLLPIVLQSVMGGGGLGDLGGLGGLTGLGSGVDVLPIDQASYAPYAGLDGDLTSQLLPSLLARGGSGGLF
jgi:hypothetical protein